jgi:nicotinamide-nucleotide amidase
MVAAAITEIAGSSSWFERGFVTYSNQAKIDLLNVPAPLLETVGAVSEPVAQAMAQGALRNSQAQLALSITGIAGPGGGSASKPVGMVCFGWADHLQTRCETHIFQGNRQQVRAQAATHALRGVLAWLSEKH